MPEPAVDRNAWTREASAAPAQENLAARGEADRGSAARALLVRIAADYSPAALATSFGVEDMVLIDLVARHRIPIGVFALDTGRLPAETYDLIDRTREQYGLDIHLYYPDAGELGRYASAHGVNAFYREIALRERCCEIRKTHPLERALAGCKAWVTGLRREQSSTRRDVPIEDFDAMHGIAKFNPLADWRTDDVWDYVNANGVPYNVLHDRGYPSIGCAPCTRAVAPGEDLRAGRWWWEQAEHRECGLHRRPLDIPIRSGGAPGA